MPARRLGRVPAIALAACLALSCLPVTRAGADVACPDEPVGPTTHLVAARAGVPPELTSVDVYRPAGCGPFPVVVWVHGGGWRTGDKRGRGVAEKVALARSLGAALVSVNYRLSRPGAGVLWPDHGDDVASALTWIVRVGPSHGLDGRRLAVMGHSAGGHLVSIVATDPDLLRRHGLASGVLDCVVAVDTEGYDLAHSAAAMSGLVANAFGDDPAVIADASPLVQVLRHGAPPAAFLVITRGTARRQAIAAEFAAELKGAGGTASVLDVRPYTHAEANTRLGAAGERIETPATRRFLRDCLRT